MTIRGFIASLAALTIAVALPIAAAAPAQAGVNPGLITLEVQGGKCVASPPSIIGNPGSAFSIHNVDCGSVGIANANFTKPVTDGRITLANTNTHTFTLATTSGVLGVQGGVGGVFLIQVTITDTPIEDPKPHDYFQGVGVPESGDCVDVDPAVGHYPGYPIGGWSKSWAQWINDGAGGAVCTREIEEEVDGTIVLVD